MQYILEEESRSLIIYEVAFKAVRDTFIAAAVDIKSTVFPTIIAYSVQPTNVFTIKSGTIAIISNIKVGSY